MKVVSIAGNIGKDAEVRRTQDGTPVASWSVAVEERSGREKSVMWFDVSLWGARGEKLAPYIHKGGKIAVTGELGKREYEGKTYFTVRASEVTLQGGAGRKEDPAEAYSNASHGGGLGDLDDEVPFAPEVRV